MDHFQNNQHSFKIWGGDSYNGWDGMGWDGTRERERDSAWRLKGLFWAWDSHIHRFIYI